MRCADCVRCHLNEKPRDRNTEDDGRPERETGASGLFTPMMVLNERQPVSSARAADLNARDPFVDVLCDDEPAQFDGLQFKCPGKLVPEARRRIREGLAKGHAYTRRVCDSRRYLFEHLDDERRRVFKEAFSACGIGP